MSFAPIRGQSERADPIWMEKGPGATTRGTSLTLGTTKITSLTPGRQITPRRPTNQCFAKTKSPTQRSEHARSFPEMQKRAPRPSTTQCDTIQTDRSEFDIAFGSIVSQTTIGPHEKIEAEDALPAKSYLLTNYMAFDEFSPCEREEVLGGVFDKWMGRSKESAAFASLMSSYCESAYLLNR
jgi:hypothetical protein